jgi:NTE family protein
MSDNNSNSLPKIQRALVLQGGGTLGAYEAGVLKILCKYFTGQDKKNDEKGRLLFDVVAGTSIGAMNGAILVSKVLENKSWKIAVEELERFWNDKESGLDSTVDIDKTSLFCVTR